MTSNKLQVIYKLDGIDAEDGVDVFEIAPVLMHFGDLIRSANSVLGYEKKIDIKIKPVRAGSWIADFVLQHGHSAVEGIFNYFKSDQGVNLLLILNLLGLNFKEGIVGVANVVRFTKGFVNKFQKNADETVTYESPTGEKMTISLAEHRLVQSPLIQSNYYNCVIAPFDKFPTATSVSFTTSDDVPSEKQTFYKEDKEAFDQYVLTELLEDVEESISSLSGVFLKPKRGSYSGEEKQYSFVMGENIVLWPVTVDDLAFLEKMRLGELRLYAEDVLKVDLEIKQKKDKANKISTSYAIKKVNEYIKYEKPRQLDVDEFLKKNKEE